MVEFNKLNNYLKYFNFILDILKEPCSTSWVEQGSSNEKITIII